MIRHCCTILMLCTIVSVSGELALGQTAGWTENAGNTTTNNKVGIGTTSPATTLDVNGTTVLRGAVTLIGTADFINGASPFTILGGPSGNSIYGSGIDTTLDIAGGRSPFVLQWHTGLNFSAHSFYGGIRFFNQAYPTPYNSQLVMALTDGRVGIGTATPGAQLDVNGVNSNFGTSAGGARLNANNGNNGTAAGIWLRYTDGNSYYDSDNDLYFRPGPGQGNAMIIKSGGNVGIGTTIPSSRLHVAGNITVDGNINAKYQDIAEWVSTSKPASAGTVVVIDAAYTNVVMPSSQAYDTKVAGVVSANPGIVLGEAEAGKAKVATTGRVKVRVDATTAPIHVGDLLVSSDKEGVAMRSMPIDVAGVKIHRPGTLIGKALEPLETGEGEVLVLLSLQ